MIYTESFCQQSVLSLNHVSVTILGEMSAKSVTWLAGLPVTDPIGKNDEVTSRIQRLPDPEQFAAKSCVSELSATATRAVQDQHCVPDDTLRIAFWLANRPIM